MFPKSEIKEIRKIFTKYRTKKKVLIEKILSALKKYFNHDDAKYIGIKDAGCLFKQSTDKSYHKPMRTESVFNHNCIEYESNEDKDKNLPAKNYLNRIRPYSSDIINDYKAFKFRVHKTILIFKINIFKLCKKYAKLLKSSIGLGFLKNYYKDIK